MEIEAQQPVIQGEFATRTGKHLESLIENTLKQKGYEFVSNKTFSEKRETNQPIFTRHYKLTKSIYESDLICDFLVFHPTKYPSNFAIEAKWQQSAGSVDEKFPFLVHNIKEKYPCPAIIVLDGGGYKKTADSWLRKQVDTKLTGVFNIAEFIKWANLGGL